MERNYKIYAVDFDGTLCENAWPDIGAPRLDVIEHFKVLQAGGDKLILNTCRTGYLLEQAVKWCRNHGLEFDAVNANLTEMIQAYGGDCRKIGADFYCDDKNYPIPGRTPLNALAQSIHQTAVEHGWHDEPRTFGDIVALCHSELSEALEEYRAGRPMEWYACEEIKSNPGICNPTDEWDCTEYRRQNDCKYRGKKPEGAAVEMIDCLIRILDWCAAEGVDVDRLVEVKTAYNRTRPYRHGGKKL